MRRYALAGPPNVGKSSLFYAMTGIYVKTANYPGTTTEIHRGYVKIGGEVVELVDLPGILHPESPRDEDEAVAMREIVEGEYDGVFVVVAPHAVREGLKIAEVAARHKPVALIFNMADIWRPSASEEEMSLKLSVPVVYASATKRLGLEKIRALMAAGWPRSEVRLGGLEQPPLSAVVESGIFSREPLALAVLLSIGVFTALILMALVEGVTPFGELPFSLASALEALQDAVASWILSHVGGLLGRFVAEALWGSFTVLVTIALYVFVALSIIILYEDSGLIGVLSRRAERAMASMGLPPRGAVCLLVGVSCNVPGVASARVLWGRDNRILTALLVPFMPCVARLAIFAGVAVAVLKNAPFLIPLIILMPYGVAFAFALVASRIYRWALGIRTAAFGEVPPTPILLPDVKIYARKVAVEFVEFLKRAAPVLTAFIIALWPLTAFGPGGVAEDASSSYLAEIGRALQPLFAPMGIPWEAVAPLAAGWIFKEVVLGLLEATGGLNALASSPLPSVAAYLVFVAFYSACIATLSSLYKLVGFRLTVVSIVVNLALAYTAALATYGALTLLLRL